MASVDGNSLEVHCSDCDRTFHVPKSMWGGKANCPGCRRAVDVGGGFELAFWINIALAILLVLAISGGLAVGVGAVAGTIALLIGVTLVVIGILAM